MSYGTCWLEYGTWEVGLVEFSALGFSQVEFSPDFWDFRASGFFGRNGSWIFLDKFWTLIFLNVGFSPWFRRFSSFGIFLVRGFGSRLFFFLWILVLEFFTWNFPWIFWDFRASEFICQIFRLVNFFFWMNFGV